MKIVSTLVVLALIVTFACAQTQGHENDRVDDESGTFQMFDWFPSPRALLKRMYSSADENVETVGAVVGAVASTSAAVVAPAVVSSIGFTSGGVAAGSYAASMMSAAAISNGGGIAAGTLVAGLQSVGAVGALGMTTVLPFAVVGGVVGAGAVYGYKYFYPTKTEKCHLHCPTHMYAPYLRKYREDQKCITSCTQVCLSTTQ